MLLVSQRPVIFISVLLGQFLFVCFCINISFILTCFQTVKMQALPIKSN